MRPAIDVTWLLRVLVLLLATSLAVACGGGGGDGGVLDGLAGDAAGDAGGGADGGAVDTGVPGDAADVSGDAVGVGPVVIITEFHANPCIVSDSDGEWVEVTNVTTAAVDINGWTLKDDGTDRHVIDNGGPLTVDAGLSLVLGLSADTALNSGVEVDYVYRGFTLRNSGADALVLLDASGAEVDRVAFDETWPSAECAALQLSASAWSATDNDDPASWCPATAPYGSGSNFGTPGGPNATCVSEHCGDSVVDVDEGEECDDGPDNSNTQPDACREDCTDPRCGDGVTDVGRSEACDDGLENADEPDRCRTDCVLPACGDEITDPSLNEQCDDGPAGSAECTAECRLVGAPAPAAAGDVLIVEVMRNSADSNDVGEWVELFNPTDTTWSLTGCILKDDGGEAHTIEGTLDLAPDQHLVLARSDDPVVNGGLTPDYKYTGFILENTADEAILECFGAPIDAVRYSDAEGWPDDAAYSMSLSASAYDAAANDLAANWCSAGDGDTYGDDTNHGTPGAQNPVCGATAQVDWCRLERPATIDAPAGTSASVWGRVREAGVTDVTPGADPPGALRGQVGYGPDGSDPDGNAGWTWTAAAADPAWDGTAAGAVDVDEYVASMALPAPGTYDYAFRFSADGGLTWTYCDLDSSDNDYAAAQAGALTTTASACFPNPCTEEHAAECDVDGVTLVTYPTPGVCTVDGGGFACAYPPQTTDCSLTGATCEDGACTGGARAPVAGEVIVSEVLYDTGGPLDEVDAEWFELTSLVAEPLALTGCTVGDEATVAATTIGVLLVPGNGRLLFARSANAADNGGLTPDATFTFALNNSGTESITLTCGGTVIDVVRWNEADGWPDASQAALSLDPAAFDATANDDAASWCLATDVYFAGAEGAADDHRGTPRAANPSCAGDTQVDWCRYQWPVAQESFAGTTFIAYGRVYDEGVTDLTGAVDPTAELVGEAGYGPDGSDPSAAPGAWTWFAAEGNPAWVDTAEPDNDEYMASVLAPAAGTYDLAFRFSLDGGTTWLYCDRDARPTGGDGSADGYQPANAGSLVTTSSPCEAEPCNTPDPAECQDGTTLLVHDSPGTCDVVGGDAVCTYPTHTVDCAETGATCDLALDECVGGARAPVAGEVIFSEVLYDSGAPLDETESEWFELTNLTGDALLLTGCTIEDAQPNTMTVGTLILGADARAVFARVADPALNGGLTPDATFPFGLNNSGTEVLRLTCGGVEIDAISWDESQGWPNANQASLSLDPGAFDAAANDDVASWCLGVDLYFAGDAGTATDDHLGTPGAANPACPVPDTTIDWCRYQWPLDSTVAAGTPFTAMGRVYEEGSTDLTTGVDADAALVGAAGYGPDGSDPAADAGWTWFEADGNPAWVDTDEPDVDEYMVTFAAPAAGTYDLAFRFSLDGGATWLYCDDAAEGSSNGYAAADAGSLVTEPSACDPNPCTVAPDPECTDAVTLATYSAPGDCSVVGGDPACEWPTTTTDCSLTGATCAAGACVGGARPAAGGEVIITEIQFDTSTPLAEAEAEWVELHNVTPEDLLVEGCTLSDAVPNVADLATFLIPAGESVVLGRTADTALNGGIAPVATFDFGLNNGGDDVILSCGATLIDAVTYDATFPAAPRFSIQLDPDAYDDTANDDGANWCLAAESDIYFAGAVAAEEHYGTPGEANPQCVVPDTVVDWCRLQYPLDESFLAGTPVVAYGRVWDEGITDRTTGVDAEEGLVGEAGYGPDGSDPAGNAAWTWFAAGANPAWDGAAAGEPDNDEYGATFAAPATGTYDLAYRFSLDGGATWLYCDRKVGDVPATDGSADGYQAANAGNLTTTPSPCEVNPCTVAPDPECATGVLLVTYGAPGSCLVVDNQPVCDWPSTTTDCSDTGGTCEAGACVGGAVPPQSGDLVITEIMYDTSGALSETNAEWVELTNRSPRTLLLTGCELVDGSVVANPASLDGLTLAPGEQLLLARSTDVGLNGGLTPDATFGFSLNNLPDGDTLTVRCGTVEVDDLDTVAYGDVGWPGVAPRFALSLDPDANDADNDHPANWCLAADTDVYYQGATDADDHYGTPGAPNPQCPEVDLVVDWCRFQRPLDLTVDAGAPFAAAGRYYDEGLTDQTTGIDAAPLLVAQAGYGPIGSNPGVDGTGWTWVDAAGVAGWDGAAAGEPNNDEYEATVAVAAAGSYDLAFRFSLDLGATWLYCDGDVEGSDSGYDAADAGNLVVEATGARAPAAAGELVITELMYDTDTPLTEANAEWFEVVNTTAETLTLAGCVIEDGDAVTTTIAGLLVAPGAYALFVRSDVVADNGGLVPDHVFEPGLDNGGETLSITCGATLIDTVTYDDGVTFPNGRAIAIALDPAATDDELNDDGAAWCLARARYYTAETSPVGDHYGSPGQANPGCDSEVHWCRLQWPLDETDVTAGTPFTVYGRLYEAGLTDVTDATDAHPVVWASVGLGPDASDPSVDDTGWTWTPADPNTEYVGSGVELDNDEYMATFNAPAAGTYDFAVRVSLDGGRSWTHCDRDPAPAGGADDGSSDGYQPANAGSLTTVAGELGVLLFSEYLEGGSNNKALEIYNAGANDVLLSSCSVLIYSNGSPTAGTTLALDAVTLPAGGVFVLCHTSFALGVPADICDQFGNVGFNGDDAVALECQGTRMDLLGEIGVVPAGGQWGTDPTATTNNTIRRLCSVTEGNPDGWPTGFDLTTEWEGFAQDTFDGLGTHSECALHDVRIEGFAFSPTPLTVAAGDVVRWTNYDAASHTATSDTAVWDSGTLTQGGSYQRTFDTPGVYPYHCTFHPGMTATITVQ